VNTPISRKKLIMIILAAKEGIPVRTAVKMFHASPNTVEKIYKEVRNMNQYNAVEIFDKIKYLNHEEMVEHENNKADNKRRDS